MNIEHFQRARSPEAKQQRERDILAAAGELLASEGIEAVTLRAIAERAGVVKSAIYRYFESREDILARLLVEELARVSGQLKGAIIAGQPIDDIALTIASGFADNPKLCDLIAQTAPILERNISVDGLRTIKRALINSAVQVVEALCGALPDLDPQEAQALTSNTFALIAGLWPMANPGPELQKLFQEPEFEPYAHEFRHTLADAISRQLRGALAR